MGRRVQPRSSAFPSASSDRLESKIALAENPWDIPWLVVHGRRGGSALCAAAINALARKSEIS